MKRLYRFSVTMVIAALIGASYACGSTPTSKPTQSSTAALLSGVEPQPGSTQAPVQGLFKLVKSVDVTPVGNLIGGAFARIAYVPGKDRIVVTFSAQLDQPEGGCSPSGYAYREYTKDMEEAGSDGVISCFSASDVGSLFVDNDFYLASQWHDGTTNAEGWMLAKYDAVTWKTLVGPNFYPLTKGDDPGDPMLALVNGQIDISSKVMTDPNAPGNCPYVDCWTHHQLLTPDLQFIQERVLADAIHVNLTSLLQTADGVIHFVTSTSLAGDMIVMQYDQNWKYLGTKPLKQKASAPEGVAFDGSRFYVAYLDVTSIDNSNVHLAAFDSTWNLIEDVAVTNHTPEHPNRANRPTLTLQSGHIYLAWDQGTGETTPGGNPREAGLQVFVNIYELPGQ